MSRYFELLQKAKLDEPQMASWRPSAARGQNTEPPILHRDHDSGWLKAVSILRKHWRVSTLFAAAVILTVGLVTSLSQPVYEPSSRIQIDPPGAEMFALQSSGNIGDASQYLETQARKLESDDLALAVIREIRLDQRRDVLNQGLWRQFTNLIFWANRGDSTREHSTQGRAGDPAGTPNNSPQVTPAERAALAFFKNARTVKRDTASRLVVIRFASGDPQLSADALNTLVRLFIERSYETRHAAIRESTEWLSRELDDVRHRMDKSNNALAEFQRISGIADLDQDRSTFSEQTSELSKQKAQAQAERMQLESYLQKVRSGQIEALPQIRANSVVESLTRKVSEARAELAQQRGVYGENHPVIRKLRNQVNELERQITLQSGAIAGDLQINYSAAANRERMIDAEMKRQAARLNQVSRYSTLKKEAQADLELYNSLYAKIREAAIAAASKSSNITIVDRAAALTAPTRPNKLANLAFGVLAALIGGVAVAFIAERMDNSVQDIEDVRRCTGISSIAVVPLAGHATLAHGSEPTLYSWRVPVLPGNDKAKAVKGAPKFLLDKPYSAPAEALRSLHLDILLGSPSRSPRVLLVTSSIPREGKTTVAINLALALSQRATTCLVDADLRRPAIAGAFNLDDSAGVSQYLEAGLALDELIIPVPNAPKLSVVSAGTLQDKSGVVMNWERMPELLQSLRVRFEFVVIDSPPILPYLDARAISAFADGLVFVSGAGIVPRDAVVRSMELLRQVNAAPIVEVVLNGVHHSQPGYDYAYGYGD